MARPGFGGAGVELARVESVNVGQPRRVWLPANAPGSEVPRHDLETAIAKAPLPAPVVVTSGGLTGDAQADTRHHGGPDKAVHAHFAVHLTWWGERRGWPVSPGEIGENLTLGAIPRAPGLTEAGFCLGDVVAVGGVLLQVTQPRIPCHKQAAALGMADAARVAGLTGRTGFYLRVLQEGTLRAGDVVTLLERPNPTVTVADANRFVHQARGDGALAARLAACQDAGGELLRLASRAAAP